FKVGAQAGTGILIDSADQLIFHDNLAYNNNTGINISTIQADVYNNETRGNNRGLYVDDSSATFRTTVHNNFTHDNDAEGLYLEKNVDAYGNTSLVNNGPGVYVNGANVTVRDNYVSRNGIGIDAKNGEVIHNRVAGNTGSGIFVESGAVLVSGNSVYGNARGIDVNNSQGGAVIQNNLVYDNDNYGIYVHAAGISTLLVNNTVHHEVGSAVRLENNGNNVRLFNN